VANNDTCKELSEDHVVKDRPHNLGIEISSTGCALIMPYQNGWTTVLCNMYKMSIVNEIPSPIPRSQPTKQGFMFNVYVLITCERLT